MNAFNGMTDLLACNFTFLDVFACFSVFFVEQNLEFQLRDCRARNNAYCQFTDLHDNLIRGANRVRQEISKIKTRAVIDRSKLAEFIIPRNNFVETLV